jgi:hypothetical protein
MRIQDIARRRPLGAFSLALGLAASLPGCGSEAPAPPAGKPTAEGAKAADPDDVPIKPEDIAKPKDFADAIARIEGYRNTIRDEIAAGRPTKAHRALDELDVVLERLAAIARDGGIPKERWEEVNTTAQEIRGLFNQVHSRIDAKQEPDYAAISAKVDAAIAKLKGIAPDPALAPAP